MIESQTVSEKADQKKKIKGKVPRVYVIFLLVTLFIVSLLTILNHYGIFSINKNILLVFRWIAMRYIKSR
jgi:uncharacterized membrane protein (Fun14 family)